MPRPVHEIVVGKTEAKNRPVVLAFIQHGTADTGWRYENVCPWCERTVGDVEDPDDSLTQDALFTKLQEQMAEHIDGCTDGQFRIRVFKTKIPLNTEKKGLIH